jgi:hypothetical protein
LVLGDRGRLTQSQPRCTLATLSQREGLSVPVNLQPFPARDDAFARDVTAAAEAAASDGATEDELGAMIEARLREIYPNVVVRLQDPFARLATSSGTLYAYRDGSIVADDAT